MFTSTAAKKKNDRSKFLSALMREISGDFGKSIIDNYVNGRIDNFMEDWNDLGAKMKKKSSRQRSKNKSTSSTSLSFTVKSIKDTTLLARPNEVNPEYITLADIKGRVLLSLSAQGLKDAMHQGLVDPTDWHESMYEYAKQMRLL